MIRLAHMADTHLGYRKGSLTDPVTRRNQRAQDFADAFEQSILDIIERHAEEPWDLFIHAGDIFDHPRPDMADIALVARMMGALKAAGIPQVWIAGNHDISRIRTPHTALTLLARIYAGPDCLMAVDADFQVQDFGSCVVEACSWGGWPQRPAYDGPPAKPRILVCHGEMDGHGILFEAKDRGYDTVASWYDYIALGHLHVPGMVRTNANYPGSLERCGWRDEANHQPGWVEVSLDYDDVRRFSRHSSGARPMVDFGTLDYEESEHGLQKRIEGVIAATANHGRVMGRVLIEHAPPGSYGTHRGILQAIAVPSIFHLQVDYLEPGVKWSAPEQGFRDVEPLPPIDQLFREYVESRGGDTTAEREFEVRLLEKGLDALARAEELMKAVSE